MESLEHFIQRMEQGLYEEYELVMVIMEELINPPQAYWLKEQGLQISDLLNGRFNTEQYPTVQAIFMDWNLKLGKRIFKLGGEDR
jgi:hypothetical protein